MPIRTCVGCRRRLDQDELVRIRSTLSGLALGRGPGRGAYLCPDRSCFDAAVSRRAISRALRIAADADQLARLSESWPTEPGALAHARN